MGNTPTKESRPRVSTFSGSQAQYPGAPGTQGIGAMMLDGSLGRHSRRNTTSVFGNINEYKKSKRLEERDKNREEHYMKLVVRYDESVDGGFLAPFGTYRSNLDFNTDIVRDLIITRKLAPFYTPLQDYDDRWQDEELAVLLGQLPLHSFEGAYSEEEEDDIDNHKIHKSSNYYKRQEHKRKMQMVLDKMKDSQKNEEARFVAAKQTVKQTPESGDNWIASSDLLMILYKNLVECPICFLYYPNNLNVSRCCLQPICTECFVQIKRLEPHPPHDDDNKDSEELPHTLISEPANCPYCAMSDFGVTFERNLPINTGIKGMSPGKFCTKDKSSPVEQSQSNEDLDQAVCSSSPISESDVAMNRELNKSRKRRESIPANSPKVVTVDQVRPDWESRLQSARNKLARKAAAASAIHASNLIINPATEVAEYDTRRRRQGSSTMLSDRSPSGTPPSSSQQDLLGNSRYQTVEDRMIEEALRLSIIDEEERRRKAELSTPE